MDIREQFGDIDIYLFDQLLKGRIAPPMKVLDAGCGDGRNLIYFLRHNFEVFAVDSNPSSVERVRLLASSLAPALSQENFVVGDVADMDFSDGKFDLVISSAVLHFATDRRHFDRMLDEMWRVLGPKGVLFARLASSIGIERLIKPTTDGRYMLPDGTERFLVNEEMLSEATRRLRAAKLDPVKTTNVENIRCMTTWVIKKQGHRIL